VLLDTQCYKMALILRMRETVFLPEVKLRQISEYTYVKRIYKIRRRRQQQQQQQRNNNIVNYKIDSHYSAKGIGTILPVEQSEVGIRFACSPKRPNRLWRPPSFLFSEHWRISRGIQWPMWGWPHTSSAEVKNKWSYSSSSPICLYVVYRKS